MKQNPGIELVTIHPSFVIGPPTIPRFEAFSIEPIIELLNGKYKESTLLSLLSIISFRYSTIVRQVEFQLVSTV